MLYGQEVLERNLSLVKMKLTRNLVSLLCYCELFLLATSSARHFAENESMHIVHEISTSDSTWVVSD